MKGDIFYLKDSDGQVVAKFEQDRDYMTGECYQATGWYPDGTAEYSFFASVYCKWDSCTHWNFNGEYFIPGDENSEVDAYYHLCGPSCVRDHIRLMCFIWKLAPMIIKEEYPNLTDETEEWFSEDPLLNQVIELMLDGYSIERVAANKED